MLKIRFFGSLALFLLNFSSAFAAEVPASNLVGKFGFDWFQELKAKCVALTEQSLAGIKTCQYMKEGDTGSFSGKADFYTCKRSAKSELMVYKTEARCKEELETMKANAP